MEWDDTTIARLRGLWDEGLSTAEIGRRMKITKNAVVGKAHRLLLPARPSPIRRDPDAPRAPRSKRPQRAPRVTIVNPYETARREIAVEKKAERAFIRALTPRVEPVVVTQTIFKQPRPTQCCWPLGTPRTPEFRFCGDPAKAGRPYCVEHVALAYVKLRDVRDDAA